MISTKQKYNQSFSLIFNNLSSIRLLSICLLFTQFVVAQKKDENIGTEVVNVVKPYSPTVSDAFKVKEVPTLDDNETSKKEEVKYQIFSFPVASTFTPAKGKAAGVEKAKQEILYPNYVTAGIGNYLTANAELFLTHKLDNYQYVGGKVSHLSSQGGIKGVELSDKFSETGINAMYGYNRNEIDFKANLGYKTEMYNWYGVPVESPNFNPAYNLLIKPSHKYSTLSLGGDLGISKSFFEKVNVGFISFTDNYSSSENRFIIKPVFNFDVGESAVKVKFGLDYLNTKFDTSYQLTTPVAGTDYRIEKSNFIVNANPSFKILRDDLSIELGADFAYFSRMKDVFAGVENNTKSDFFIYPKINASYKLVGDLMVFVAGAEGGLKQNTYADFASVNKFLSPTLFIEPSDNQYNIYAGLRGKLTSSVAYNVKASYDATNNKPLFKTNPLLSDPSANYSYGNSFTVVYDNIKTLSFFGEIKADINKNVTFGINAEVMDYGTKFEREAWNLPTVKGSLTADFNIGKKWYAGTQLYFVGERKDEFTSFSGFSTPDETQTLDSYFDINAHIGYKFNDRFTFFLKGNNLANQNYNRWLNYPVQGVQGIFGASYKFDF